MLVGKPTIAFLLLDLCLAAALRGRLHASAGVVNPFEVLTDDTLDRLVAATSG